MSILPASQNKRRALIRNTMIVLGLVLFALALASRTWGVAVHWPVLAVLTVFCALAVLEFVTFDEVAKHEHITAWYWGSLVGLVTIALIQVAAVFNAEALSFVRETIARGLGDATPTSSFLSGMMVAPVLMAGGFFVVRCIDWLRSR